MPKGTQIQWTTLHNVHKITNGATENSKNWKGNDVSPLIKIRKGK